MNERRIIQIPLAFIVKSLIITGPTLLICVLWETTAQNSSRFSFLFGSPSLIIRYLYNYLFQGDGLGDIFVTAGEAFAGFAVGNLVGIILGLGLAYFPKLERTVRIYIIMLGAIPIFALAPITIMWFGVRYFAKFMMAVLSTVLVATEHAYTGAIRTDPKLVTLLVSLRASRWQIFKKVVVPSSLNSVLTSFRLTVGFALIGAFIGEFISAERGLGYRILKASGLYDIPGVIGGVLLLAMLALALRGLIHVLTKVLIPWHYSSKESVNL